MLLGSKDNYDSDFKFPVKNSTILQCLLPPKVGLVSSYGPVPEVRGECSHKASNILYVARQVSAFGDFLLPAHSWLLEVPSLRKRHTSVRSTQVDCNDILLVSMLSSINSRMTRTGRIWPIRCTRSIAYREADTVEQLINYCQNKRTWSSAAAFHLSGGKEWVVYARWKKYGPYHGSIMNTTLPLIRLIPVPLLRRRKLFLQ